MSFVRALTSVLLASTGSLLACATPLDGVTDVDGGGETGSDGSGGSVAATGGSASGGTASGGAGSGGTASGGTASGGAASGGSTSTGGSTNSGGSTNTGGSVATGGSVGAGGTSTGGTTSTGGSVGTGGTSTGGGSGSGGASGCLTATHNVAIHDFGTTAAVCVIVDPSTAPGGTIAGWEAYRFDGRTITVGGQTVNSAQMPLPGSAPYTFQFSAGSVSNTGFAWW